EEVHRNTGTHGASTDDCDGLDRAQFNVIRDVGDVAGGAFGEEHMAECLRLLTVDQLFKGAALGVDPLIKVCLGRGFDQIESSERCHDSPAAGFEALPKG